MKTYNYKKSYKGHPSKNVILEKGISLEQAQDRLAYDKKNHLIICESETEVTVEWDNDDEVTFSIEEN